MKKITFLFAMLACMMASATVTVTPIGTNNINILQVTFRVEWTDTAANNRVWVWVDLCPVDGTATSTCIPGVIIAANANAGSIDAASLNGRGFYVTTNPSTVTATLSNATPPVNWCAHSSDFPPNIGDYSNGIYTLRGTPPFTLTDDSGTTQVVSGNTVADADLNIVPITMTDATGCPGIWCIYTGSDLYVNATHQCKKRTGGDKNWEAWIKDARDGELYRVVKMPDNKWWLAQNVKYATTGSSVTISGCTPDKCGRAYTGAQANGAWGGSKTGIGANVQGVCPPGWILPLNADWYDLRANISTDVATICRRIRALDSPCGNAEDYYGFANIIGYMVDGAKYGACGSFRTNDSAGYDWVFNWDCGGSCPNCCNQIYTGVHEANRTAPVRCLRQL
jgi:uncharacterized protein (TIGR02145 family)